jgi:hypothetical protein
MLNGKFRKHIRLCFFTIIALLGIALAAYAAPGGNKGNKNGRGGGSASAPAACSDHIDNDGDGYCDYAWKKGYCSDGSLLGDPKCASKDDTGEACSPSTEVCDGVDNNCDGQVDENGVCGTISYYCDGDQDGYLSATVSDTCSSLGCVPAGCSTTPGTDCNDVDITVNPAAVDNCDSDGVDNDCDGTVDECDSCINGKQDGNETDVDCGGSCAPCDLQQACNISADCLSGNCQSGICAEAQTNLDPSCLPIKYTNGSVDNHVNLVMVPSAFNGDMDLFRQKAEWIASVFGNYEPYDQSISRYNVFYVPEEAGDYCYFNCSGIQRLLCCDTSKAKSLSATCTTGPRQTIVVHNSDTYGGAGYRSSDVATTSIHSAAPLVAVHELGHSLFNLGDEYSTGSATPSSSANCDYSSCSKWGDMLGYNGVGCLGNSCSGGSYSVSENTIMKALSYRFEEVNLRLSCCTYQLETGEFPAYCDQFKQFTISGDLNEFCQNPTPSGVSAVPSDYLAAPREFTFVWDSEIGDWTLESSTARRPGYFPTVQTRGQGQGAIRVDVAFENGRRRQLRFSSEEDVEFPGAAGNPGGYVQLPRQAFTVVIEQRNDGPVRFIRAQNER